MSSKSQAAAANRFGLGAMPGELDRVGRDPRAWLKAQLDAPPDLAPFANLPSGLELLQRRAAVQAMRRADRKKGAGEDAQMASVASEVAPPPLAAGKEYLVRNTAALLRVAGHHSHALERYFAAAVEAVRVELHAPRDLTTPDVPAWLERVRAARGGTIPFPELRDQVAEAVRTRNARAVLEAADRVHRWRQEMTHGPRHHS